MRYSYNFGTLDEGVLSFAPKPFVIDGEKFWTNSEEIHRLGGFLPILRTEMPYLEGTAFSSRFETEGTPPRIVEHWDAFPPEPEPEA